MISSHILDTASGRPAAGVAVRLEKQLADGVWKPAGEAVTDADGRVKELLAESVEATTYRLTFATGAYFPEGLYPEVSIVFAVRDASRHYHIPLLLSPHGYTTYRGS